MVTKFGCFTGRDETAVAQSHNFLSFLLETPTSISIQYLPHLCGPDRDTLCIVEISYLEVLVSKQCLNVKKGEFSSHK